MKSFSLVDICKNKVYCVCMPELRGESQIIPPTSDVPENYGKDLSGRLVTFGEGDNMAWGIEIDVPVDDGLRKYLHESSVTLPPRIKKIKFLTLSPQESLSPELRNIHSKRTIPSALQNIADITSFHPAGRIGWRPFDYLDREFIKVIPSHEDRKKLEEIVNAGEGEEVLIVQGHGGGDPMIIGEQTDTTPVDSDSNQIQRTGNNVLVQEILNKYHDASKFSVILLDSCYTGAQTLVPKDVPVVYVHGLSGLSSNEKGTRRTVFVYPQSE